MKLILASKDNYFSKRLFNLLSKNSIEWSFVSEKTILETTILKQ